MVAKEQRQLVTQRLKDRLDGVGDRVVAAIAREIPAYAEMGETQIRETRAIAMWAVERLADLWLEDGTLTNQDLRRFHGIGVSRAIDGRPLLVVLRAYRVAAVETSDTLVALGDDLQIGDVVALNRVLLTSVDQLSEALFTGYASGSDRLSSDRESTLRELFDDMVVGRQTSVDALADRAAQLGLAVPATAELLVVRPDSGRGEPDDDELAHLAAAISPVTTDPGSGRDVPMILWRRQSGLGAVLAPALQDVEAELRHRTLLGCVISDVSLPDLPSVYRLAASALDHAPQDAFDSSPLLRRGDALVVALLSGQPSVRPAAIAHEVLGPVMHPDNVHVLEGLSAYLRFGSATEAAAALGLHAQTLRNRRRRVAALTGRDPRRAWDRLVLDIARTAIDARTPR